MNEFVATTVSRKPSVDWWCTAICLVAAFGLRLIISLAQSDQLTRDRDAYLGIATSIADGRGYSVPDSETPTAFRPPLYPLVLAAGMRFLSVGIVVGTVNTLAGLATVWVTISIGRNLGLGRLRFLAGLLVAVDPLLLQYSVRPMTEVLCTLLAAVWLWTQTKRVQQRDMSRDLSGFASGFAFGLLVLCRPTFWPVAILSITVWSFTHLRQHRGSASRASLLQMAFAICGTAAVVAPWILRNWYVFGSPILMTTHGGYTLILGNNASFVRDEVQQPWGTVWPDASQQAWESALNQRMNQALGPQATDLQRDAWLSQQARSYMVTHPVESLLAMWHRVRSLWNTSPQKEGHSELNQQVLLLVHCFYLIELVAALVGGVRVCMQSDRRRWLALMILIISVQSVHLFYWTNTRMRAPLMPAIALLSAACVSRRNSGAADIARCAPANPT